MRDKRRTDDVFMPTVTRGFLPQHDPLDRLPPAFAAWDEFGRDLPKLLATTRIRSWLRELPEADVGQLGGEPEWERAMLLLSYFGHAYVWGEPAPVAELPAAIAVPWHAVAAHLGRPPVLSYASYALHNWRRMDPQGPVALGNIVLLQNFLGGIDEEWFILIHVDIEAKAGAALTGMLDAQQGVADASVAAVENALERMATALAAMYDSLSRMPELCDPYVYYNRVRPYIHGWKNNPSLPEGLRYAGVTAYAEPQKFAGETGAQSSIIPALDACLGIAHDDDPLRPYLLDMRNYMPPAHRGFIEQLERAPALREFVLQHRGASGLREAYNRCVTWVERFRSKHLEYAAQYIFKQAQSSLANPTSVGTGSTPFMPYLKKHRDETSQHLVR